MSTLTCTTQSDPRFAGDFPTHHTPRATTTPTESLSPVAHRLRLAPGSGEPTYLSPVIDESFLSFISLVMTRFSGGNLEALTAVRQVAEAAYRYCNDLQGKHEAINWAEGFVFPKTVFERDAIALAQHGGSLSALVASVHSAASAHRFSAQRVQDVIPCDDPCFQYLLELSAGMRIRLPTPYTPLSSPPSA